MDEVEDSVDFFEEGCGGESDFKGPCELCCSSGVCVGQTSEVGPGDFFLGGKQGGMSYVDPQCAVISGGVSKGGLSCGSDLKFWRDIDSVNNFGSMVVFGWGFFMLVAIADGGDEAQFA